MRFALIAATIVAFLLTACNGPTKPTPRAGPENTPVETPAATEPMLNAPPTQEMPENTLIETPEYTGVIVSEDGAAEFSYLFDSASTAFWEPSVDDISRAEECIKQFIEFAQQNPNLDTYQQEKLEFILKNLEKYRRQYVGIDVDGEKRIWCNAFFSADSFPGWERIPVDVDGGGNYYWRVEYDMLKDECINFYVHGES